MYQALRSVPLVLLSIPAQRTTVLTIVIVCYVFISAKAGPTLYFFKYFKTILDTVGISIHILQPACQVLKNIPVEILIGGGLNL